MFHTDLRRSNDDHLHEWAKDVGSRLKQNKNYSIHYIGYGQFDFDQDVNLIEKICSDKNVIVFCFDFLLQENVGQIINPNAPPKNLQHVLAWRRAITDQRIWTVAYHRKKSVRSKTLDKHILRNKTA